MHHNDPKGIQTCKCPADKVIAVGFRSKTSGRAILAYAVYKRALGSYVLDMKNPI
ncbi:hypothetical protein DPMN_005124 [Dreissena polymorpha]|uniref:Uncharacterized protein n=1 Tax=Dreissena polymorpha TaxID=45954 RepID=A0A9D4MSW9_DREPO|nr:hypothetical protein DPMN_005124 [Dreissena polymorpha]